MTVDSKKLQHDLKGDLASVKMVLNYLLDEEVLKDRADLLELIEAAKEKLAAISNNIEILTEES